LLLCFMLISSLTYSLILKTEVICSSETSVDFNGLHFVISQKIELSISTAVRISTRTGR
jgi:hypothetical protein